MKLAPKILMLFAILLLSSCSNSKKTKSGGTIHYSEREPIQVWDPMLISHSPTSRMLNHIHEGLVKLNPRSLAIEPALCESFHFDEEKLAYVFKLKKNIYFHKADCFEGKEERKITSQDVKYSFERLCKSQFILTGYLEAFKNIVVGAEEFHEGKNEMISGIKTPNEKTIIIELKYPHSPFLEKIANPRFAIVSKKAIDKYSTKSKVGAGPFRFISINESTLTLSKHQDYYLKDHNGKTLPYLDTVIVSFEGSTIGQINDLKAGKTDLILNLRASVLQKLMTQGESAFGENHQVRNAPHLSTCVLEFNLSKAPFTHPDFRKAINMAIDKEKLSSLIFGKTADRVGKNGVTHPSIYPSDSYLVTLNNFDPAKAMEIIEKMEDSLMLTIRSKPIELEVSKDDPMAIEAGNEIAYQLKQNLGLNIQLNIVPALYKIEKSKFARGDMYISLLNAKYPSPESFLIHFYGGNVPESLNQPSYPNTTRFNNEHFNYAFIKGRRSLQVEDALRYYSIAEKNLMKANPISVLWYGETNQIVNSKLENLELNSLLKLDFRYVKWRQDSIIQ